MQFGPYIRNGLIINYAYRRTNITNIWQQNMLLIFVKKFREFLMWHGMAAAKVNKGSLEFSFVFIISKDVTNICYLVVKKH